MSLRGYPEIRGFPDLAQLENQCQQTKNFRAFVTLVHCTLNQVLLNLD